MAEIGRFTRLALENDIDGYTQYIWTHVLERDDTERQLFLRSFREMLKDPRVHIYFEQRVVMGQKPISAV